jgi:hypothetical protein
MTQKQIKEVLEKHLDWLNDENGGEVANLNGANLYGANLYGADLRGAYLQWANFSGANLNGANLREADLREADLRGAYLQWANFSGANLNGANLHKANLSGANLSGANLSGAIGLLSSAEYMQQNFICDDNGYIVYRAQNGRNEHPKHWVFEPGKFLTEVPNADRCTGCGCGVSFATLKWVKNYNEGPYWRCRINWKDLLDTIIPYNTDGKGRCARLELLEIVEE